jgi:integrase
MGQGARPPVTRKLRYLKSYRDRHGRERHYFRKPGHPAVPIPGEHGSKAFMETYWRLMEGAPKRELGAAAEDPGSVAALIALYYKSSAFKGLAEITRVNYRNMFERVRRDFGKLKVRGVKYKHVAAMLDTLAEKPGAQKNLRRVWSILLTFAKERGWREDNPMVGMRRPRKASEGYRTWTEDDIAKYEAHWPSGSRERLALHLLLYTGQRRSDVRVMGRQHIAGKRIKVKQQKTGTELWIPLHSRLRAEIAAAPKTNMTLLTTQYGEPFSPAGFGNWFGESAREAGLPPGSTAHGLRKAAARRLAEAGCTAKQIMAVTGHKHISEVTLYTDAADQEKLAEEAMARVENGTEVSNATDPVRQSAENV